MISLPETLASRLLQILGGVAGVTLIYASSVIYFQRRQARALERIESLLTNGRVTEESETCPPQRTQVP